MRGHGTSIMPVTAGCRKDIEHLLRSYKEMETLRYQPFIKLFEKTNFATIFMGRISAAELYEFSEKILQIAISYAMSYRERKPAEYAEESTAENEPISLSDMRFSNEMTLQERMFGIYLTYALYFVQPEGYVAQVRITPDQIADLISFINECLIPERHVDAFAALTKLINAGAFRIYAFEKEHNPLLHRRFDLSELDEGGNDELDSQEHSFIKALGDDIVLTQADIICKRYLAAKEEANLPPEFNINIVQSTVSDIYNNILKSTEVEKEANISPKRIRLSSENKGRSRLEIKEKAYRSNIVHTRHRRHMADSSISSNDTISQHNRISTTQIKAAVTNTASPDSQSSDDGRTLIKAAVTNTASPGDRPSGDDGTSIAKTLRNYAMGGSEKELDMDNMDDTLTSEGKSLSETDSSVAGDVFDSITRTPSKETVGKRRRKNKLSISEMSLAELSRDLGENVKALHQEEKDIENMRKERMADRLMEKIQKAQTKKKVTES